MKAQQRYTPSIPALAHRGRRALVAWAFAALTAGTAHAGVWTAIGPRGDFGPTIGEACNGRVASIQIDVRNHELYVGASSGGLWRTDPTTGLPPLWQDLGQQLPHPSVGAIALHPVFFNDILVGTGDSGREFDALGGFNGGAGMFHTTDAGAHWAQVLALSPQNPAPTTFYRILYVPGSADTILAATSSGLLRSVLGPNGPWNTMTNGAFTDLVFDPFNSSTAYAFVINGPVGTGIYKSVNAGQSWSLIRAVSGTVLRGAVAVCRHTAGVVVSSWEAAVTVNNKTNVNVIDVIKSVDGGVNWPSIAGAVAGAGGQADVMVIAVAPNDPNQVYVGSTQLWWTLNNGVNWETTGPLPITHHGDITQLYFDPLDDSALWFCSDAGVYRYHLGDTQSASFNGNNAGGLQISQFYKVDAIGNLRFGAMQDDGIIGSLDGGSTWKSFHTDAYLVDGGSVAITSPDNVNPAFWFIYGISQGSYPVARGQFNGSITTVITPDPSLKVSGLAYDRLSNRIFTVKWNGPSGSELNSYPPGANSASDGTLESTGPQGVEGISGSYFDGQTFFQWVKAFRNVVQPPSFNVLVYRRAGAVWNRTQAMIGTPGESNTVNEVTASRQWPGEAWATLNGASGDAKVFHSNDYGVTWTDISGDLTGLAVGGVNTIAISPFDNNELYIGTGRGGVFRSAGFLSDGRRHWAAFQDGLPLVSVTNMKYVVDEMRTGTDKLVIGTYGRGMYERALDRVGPVYVDLRQIFPPWLGTLDLPYPTMPIGISSTLPGARLLLNGALNYSGAAHLNAPMTIGSYGTPAHLGP